MRSIARSLNPDGVKMAWNGARRVVTFTISDPEKGGRKKRVITSNPLGKGFLRHIVKFGQSVNEDDQPNSPAVVFEGASYMQVHPGYEVMMADQKSILRELAKDLHAVTSGRILMPASRNPGGVYSDHARSGQTEKYVIDVPEDSEEEAR